MSEHAFDDLLGDMALPQLERAVIAAVILDARVLRFALAEVSGADFADARLGALFDGITGMAARWESIDVLTVGSALNNMGVRGVSVEDLHSWITELPTASNVGWYAARVREAAMRRRLHEAGMRLTQSSRGVTPPAEVLAQSIEALRHLQESGLEAEVTARPLGSVLEGEDDYDWVIEGLLERGDRLLLTGQEGGGKTTLVRQVAILAASGIHPFGFRPMKPARVLVVDAENSEKQWRRAVRPIVTKAATRGSLNPAEVVSLACINRIDLTRDRDLGMVHKLLDQTKPDVLFIGPLYRLIPRAINSDDEAAPLLAALDTLRERGVAMVIEAHAGHAVGSGGERDMRPRGSAALLGWPEFGLGLRTDKSGRSSNEFQLVRWRGDRDERKWPTRISRGISDWPWTPTGMIR